MRIYAATVFIAAFLLFQIEPIIAKYILPWFGGTAAVWTTCLLFFQMLLLAGYTYAHLIGTRIAPRRQAALHLGLVAVCIVAMGLMALRWHSPVIPGAAWKPQRLEFPVARILIILSVSIGLPYFVLSATAPLLQSWFARVYPAASPYRLYALSNLGSLIALLTYPFVVEPSLALRAQANIWSAAYLLFAIGIALCAIPVMSAARPAVETRDEAAETAAPGVRALWIVLPACASFLLYASTSQMTQDTAPIPFLWVLPLALYLLSFIICFDSERWYRREIFHPLLGAAIFASFFIVIYVSRISAALGHLVLSPNKVSLIFEIGNVLLLMFAGCMVCHGELVRLKPHRRDLTAFYLMVSAGGALGGLLSVVVAPIVFAGFWDFRLAVWTCVVLMTVALMRDRESWIYRCRPAYGIAILAVALAYPLLIRIVTHKEIYAGLVFAVVGAAAFTARAESPPRWLSQPGRIVLVSMLGAIAMLAAIFVETTVIAMHDTLWMTRNFYGVFRVVETDTPDHRIRSYRLLNGRVSHGAQFFSSTDERLRYYPATYYSPDSGIGLVMMNHPRRVRSEDSSLRVGVIGLGAGAISAWARPGDYFRFYEINPEIIRADNDPVGFFTYLRDSSAKIDLVPGDARLSMEREIAEGHPQQFDVLVIDAFNGDSIPVHLLTREAMYIYLAEMKPDGVLAVHISNLYLDLRPVLAGHSRALGLRYGFVHTDDKDIVDWGSDWVLLARNDKILGLPAVAAHLQSSDHVRQVRAWTDDYSNLFQILK